MPDKVGQQIGNYRLIRLLGSGGFADVYLGQHVHILHLQAAIKFLHARLAQNFDKEFLQEAETIASLKHPHIIRIIDFGIVGEDNAPYLIMDYAPGGTLRVRHPKGSRIPLPTVSNYVKQIAGALQYAHDRKLIHRDLKPENLLVGSSGEILLCDFGIAAISHSTSSLDTDIYAGTVPYSAPEQIHGKPHLESDQYALGVIVYEWLTGTKPFTGNVQEIIFQHIGATPPSLRERVPTIPPEVEQVVMISLAKDPKHRFGSIQAFATAFEQACDPLVHPFPVTPPTTRGNKFLQTFAKPRNAALLALVLLVVLLSVFGGLVVNSVHSNQNATATAIANPYGGTLTVNDPLSSNTGNWHEVTSPPGTCRFTGGAYHVSEQDIKFINFCWSSSEFVNFAVEVQMTIIKGDAGAISFRSNPANLTFYYFLITVDGRYDLIRVSGSGNLTILVPPTLNPVLKQGLGQTNTIAVVAQGSQITLYANHQKLASASDSTYSFGNLGLAAIPYHTGGNPTEVVYSNAKVWTLVPQSNVTTQTPTTNVNPYTNTGTLALNDPLQGCCLGNGWAEGSDQSGICAFTGGAYHVSTLSATSGHGCIASPDFRNFAFEVQMTILKGDQGGIVFRYDNALNAQYRFDVVQDGSYELIAEKGAPNLTLTKFKTLIKLTSNPAIHQGLGQTNIIAVVAQGSTITLYVNEQQIASVTDNNFSHGNIGLVAAANAKGGHPTEVAFRNAKVWTL